MVGAGDWATEPLGRREILFESPIRIAPGASVAGVFEPDHRGPFVIQLRFREAWLEALSEEPRGGQPALEALGKEIGGGWLGEAAPAGFVASYSVRSGGRPIASGLTDDRLVGFHGFREVGVDIASIAEGRPSPHEFAVRVDRAVDGLSKWDARLVVAATGDWISYAGLEALSRIVYASVAVPVVLLFLYLLSRRSRRTQSRAALPKPS